ncbi:MAG TPA: LptE family protein [Tepidisphaeraceae bacterium]|nr:LptE family protein [Tepidisphaeraceae bacterium]
MRCGRFAPWRALLAISLTCGGCGYHWSDNGSNNYSAESGYPWNNIYRKDVSTVAVPIFTNRTFYRGVEFNLTKSVVTQIESRTPYKVVPKDRADTILEGEIIDAGVHLQSRSQQMGLPQEQLFYLIVNFTWKDLRNGKILTSRHAFSQVAPYYPTLAEDRFLGSQEAVEQLGVAIVEELEADWGNTKTGSATAQTKP